MGSAGSGASLDLDGHVAVVTGGSQGIGQAIAGELAAFGCRVVVSARRPDVLEEAVSAIRGNGGQAVGVAGDLCDSEHVGEVVSRANDAFGGVDVLVNNAGGSFGDDFRRGALLDLDEQDLLGAYRMNVLTTFNMARAVVPVMRSRGGGSIVNISSVLVSTPMADFGAYSAAKAAVVSLTRTMAIEWAPTVRVNALLVGHIATERASRNRSAETVAWLERHIAMGRLGDPVDVAGTVAYLCSDLARWVTGATLEVDGGVRAL
ncbi:MAG: glucose 1-dehydrogenase [Propionibacteriales bacterium]|nr:glucose 1-dehydrogenase [Propionibacteriales bacterium]